MIKPRYQDLQAAHIPSVALGEGGAVWVMAGSFKGKAGACAMAHLINVLSKPSLQISQDCMSHTASEVLQRTVAAHTLVFVVLASSP